MIGHTRFATSGNPDNNANNHPFLGGPIALAHNGVIFGNLHPKQKSACDSEVILKELLAHPLKDERQTINALKKVCAKLDGSFRVVLINKNTPNAVYVANDSERPWLHLVSKAIVITSEQDNAKGVSFQLPSNVVTVVHMDHTITQASFTPKKRATRGLDWRDYSDREDTQNRSWWTRRDDSLPDTAQDTPAPGHYPADCEGCAFAADYPAEYCQECYKGHN
jgi:glutamine phosphoribosylpyrophosphate amidotransferase